MITFFSFTWNFYWKKKLLTEYTVGEVSASSIKTFVRTKQTFHMPECFRGSELVNFQRSIHFLSKWNSAVQVKYKFTKCFIFFITFLSEPVSSCFGWFTICVWNKNIFFINSHNVFMVTRDHERTFSILFNLKSRTFLF